MADPGSLTGCWRPVPDGVAVAVRVHPRARHPGVVGVAAGRLRIAVAEPPEDGRANRAACAALARALGVALSSVTVTAGAGNREKTLRVGGDPTLLVQRLSAL